MRITNSFKYAINTTSSHNAPKVAKESSKRLSTPKFSGGFTGLAPASPLAFAPYVAPLLYHAPVAMAHTESYSRSHNEEGLLSEFVYNDTDPLRSLYEANPKEVLEKERQAQAVKELFRLAEKGDKAAFKAKLEHPVEPYDPNWHDERKKTPLMAAANVGDEELVNFLISNKANIYARDITGKTAYDYAIKKKHKNVAELLSTIYTEQQKAVGHYIGENDIEKAIQYIQQNTIDPSKIFKDSEEFVNTFKALTPQQTAKALSLLKKQGVDINQRDKNGNTPLIIAAATGNQQLAEELLDASAYINIAARNGQTPLAIALQGHHIKLASFFIDQGANVNTVDRRGETPLMAAVGASSPAMVDKLIKNGAKINEVNRFKECALSMSTHPRDIYRYELAETLLANKADPNPAACDFDTLPMTLAIENGDAQMVNILLRKKAKANLFSNLDDRSFLHLVASQPDNESETSLEIAKLLIKHGTDINRPDNKGQTPLMLAAGNGNTKLMRLLIDKGAKVNVHNKAGITILGHAVNRNHLEAAQLLLEKKADPNKVSMQDNSANKGIIGFFPPLMDAIDQDRFSMRDLLIKYGADPDLGNEGTSGLSPLQFTIYRDRIHHFKWLIKNGANVNAKHPQTGLTPLMAAVIENNMEFAKLLLNAGADPNIYHSSGWFSRKVTASTLAQLSQNQEFIDLLNLFSNRQNVYQEALLKDVKNNNFEAVEQALKLGTNANYVNEKGESPLHLAIKNNNPRIAQLLLDYFANVHQFTQTVPPGLCSAASQGHGKLAKLLIENGANVNEADHQGNTPLIAAASNGHVDLAEFLIKQGADVNQANVEGLTPLMAAGQSSSLAMVKLLQGYDADICLKDKSHSKHGKTAKDYARQNNHQALFNILQREQAKKGCG